MNNKKNNRVTDLDKALNLINSGQKVAVQIAPAVRVAIGEEFGFKVGTNVVGKLVTALKQAGFTYVYDVCAGADFTILEESKELAQRIRTGKNLPLFTSCCPIWVKYLEHTKPEYKKNLSTCKSPTEMLSTLIKHFNSDVKIVSVTPCVGKKVERLRDNNIDVCLTTKECAEIIKQKNIDFCNLPDGKFDQVFGVSSGAGTIFGVTGGVMEAILRTTTHLLNNHKSKVCEIKNNNGIEHLEIAKKTIRTNNGFREVTISTAEGEVNIAIVNGIKNTNKLFNELKNGKVFHFVEFQNCAGGCVMGPGQPVVDKGKYTLNQVVKLRGNGLYEVDKTNKVKTSQANENVLGIYHKIGEEKIEELLHIKQH